MTTEVAFDSRTATDRRTGAGRRRADKVRVTPDMIVDQVVEALSVLFEHPDADVRIAATQACIRVGQLTR